MKSMEVMQYPVISVPLSRCVIFSECSVVCRDDNCMVSRWQLYGVEMTTVWCRDDNCMVSHHMSVRLLYLWSWFKTLFVAWLCMSRDLSESAGQVQHLWWRIGVINKTWRQIASRCQLPARTLVHCPALSGRTLSRALLHLFFRSIIHSLTHSFIAGIVQYNHQVTRRTAADVSTWTDFLLSPKCPDRLWGPPSLLFRAY